MNIDIADHRRRLAASQARLAAVQAERQPARRGKSRQPMSKLKQLQRRHARLTERQLPQFHASIAIPSGTARPLPLPPRLARQIGDAVAQSGAMVRLQSRSLRIERRGREVPSHVVELVASHVSAIAAWIRAHRCSGCGHAGRLQPVPGATAGAPRWAVCPSCERVLRSP